MAKYNVRQIAKWFVKKDAMTQKRLQKLCYYAEAWYFTLKNKELFENDLEAWAHGPVSQELRNSLGPTGLRDIDARTFSRWGDVVDPDDIELLELVWNTYGDLGANALEALTHTELPWVEARTGCKDGERCNNVISLETMRKYYSSIYKGGYGE